MTLRDGEQQAGVEFTSDDKVRIATALAEAGIHRIEAGLPAVSPSDADAIKRMVGEGLPPRSTPSAGAWSPTSSSHWIAGSAES